MTTGNTKANVQANEPDQPEQPYGEEAITNALALWRSGYEQTIKPALSEGWRNDYALASTALAVGALAARCHTMQELLHWYYHKEDLVERLVRVTIETVQSDPESSAAFHLLNETLVEDAAFWRRYQSMLTSATTA